MTEQMKTKTKERGILSLSINSQNNILFFWTLNFIILTSTTAVDTEIKVTEEIKAPSF